MAYQNQSQSLKFVQKFGSELEKAVREALGWPQGRVVYYQNELLKLKYDLQVDACWPNQQSPRVFVSITYCKPDKPGHSNENKLQLKLGELMLLKARFPEISSVLVVGGNRETWIPYVLKAFQFFFDRTIFAWEADFQQAVDDLRTNPVAIPRRHNATWQQLAQEWSQIELWNREPIDSSLRKSMWEMIGEIGCEGELPEQISNKIFRHCMQAAYNRHKQTRGKNGKEWSHYLNENWDRLWQSRSFFNPAEAAIELSLESAGLAFGGGLARDEEVPSLIHHLGGEEVDNTKVSEDFVLYSRQLDRPVFIQSKSTGGGLKGHGKNIQNRTKEQLARSLLYRGSIDDNNNIVLRSKDYYWIAVLDGNWGVTKKTPLKYLYMLQWAGYDFLMAADSLVLEDLTLKAPENNPLIAKLLELECLDDRSRFEQKWAAWCELRFKDK